MKTRRPGMVEEMERVKLEQKFRHKSITKRAQESAQRLQRVKGKK